MPEKKKSTVLIEFENERIKVQEATDEWPYAFKQRELIGNGL